MRFRNKLHASFRGSVAERSDQERLFGEICLLNKQLNWLKQVQHEPSNIKTGHFCTWWRRNIHITIPQDLPETTLRTALFLHHRLIPIDDFAERRARGRPVHHIHFPWQI